jgi:hypothetical protein
MRDGTSHSSKGEIHPIVFLLPLREKEETKEPLSETDIAQQPS